MGKRKEAPPPAAIACRPLLAHEPAPAQCPAPPAPDGAIPAAQHPPAGGATWPRTPSLRQEQRQCTAGSAPSHRLPAWSRAHSACAASSQRNNPHPNPNQPNPAPPRCRCPQRRAAGGAPAALTAVRALLPGSLRPSVSVYSRRMILAFSSCSSASAAATRQCRWGWRAKAVPAGGAGGVPWL